MDALDFFLPLMSLTSYDVKRLRKAYNLLFGI